MKLGHNFREITRIWTKRKWNYSLISRVYHLIIPIDIMGEELRSQSWIFDMFILVLSYWSRTRKSLYHNNAIIITIIRHALLSTLLVVGTPSEVSKLEFSDNFVSKNSAQVQNFTNWHCRVVNLVDCSVLCIERNSERALLWKDIRR